LFDHTGEISARTHLIDGAQIGESLLYRAWIAQQKH
jgi:hypothetical protein